MIAKASSGAPPEFQESYLSRVFFIQYNVILLGGAALFSLASASLVPLLVGLSLEVLYLGIGTNSPALRRHLDARDAPPAPAPVVVHEVSRAPAPPALDHAYLARVRLLEKALAEIRRLGSNLEPSRLQHAGASLDTLAQAFASHCESHQRLSKYVASTPEAALRAELDKLKQGLATEKDPTLRMAIRQSMVLAQRRIDQRAQADASLRAAGVRLETFERAVASLLNRGRTLGLNQELVADLDALRHEVVSEALDEPARPRSVPPPSV